jgi:SAM-dependent methyltransferase
MSEYEIDWAKHAEHLATVAGDEAGWYSAMAAGLALPTDTLAVDVGCGGGGMATALAGALPPGARVVALDGDEAVLAGARTAATGRPGADRIEFVRADLAEPAALGAAIGGQADLVWASASVHHAPDQQAAINGLAKLLAPGGRLALAEGGLRPRHLPWNVGVGAPGLEVRLDAAQDRWFAAMRAALPGAAPMPYGWNEALRRAGLTDPISRNTLVELPPPLPPAELERVVAGLRWKVDRVRRVELLDPDDDPAWARLLDPADPAYLGNRADVFRLEVRSVHVGHSPG